MHPQAYVSNDAVRSEKGGSWLKTVIRLCRRVSSPQDFPLIREWALTSLRVIFGLMVFFIHGVHKVTDVIEYLQTGASSKFLQEVAAMGVPMPTYAAGLAAVVQLLGGLLIAVGLFTRPAAVALAGALSGAIAQNLSAGRDPQLAVLYTLVAVTFAVAGAGRYSLDTVIWNRTATRFTSIGGVS